MNDAPVLSELRSSPALLGWLALGERGISSNTIVAHLSGLPCGPTDVPHDPSDFIRCEKLLRHIPLMRLVFKGEMPSAGPVWAELVAHWDEIVALIEEEAPDAFGASPRGSAPKAYALIKQCRGVA